MKTSTRQWRCASCLQNCERTRVVSCYADWGSPLGQPWDMNKLPFCRESIWYLHWKCLYVVDELCSSILCSLLWFWGKLINMIQKTENTNAEALTLGPHLLLCPIIAPNYLIGPLWLCSVTEKNMVYCETPSNHNAISNSIPIKSTHC